MDSRTPPSDGDRNLGPVFATLSVVTVALACCCVTIRTYICVKWTHAFGFDDAFIIAALLIAITGVAFNILSVDSGAGRHQYYLTISQISNTVKWNTASQIVNIPCITLTKISIFLFILRIQNTGVIAWIVYISMAATLAINIPTLAVLSVQCRPLAGLWDPEIPAKCESIQVLQIVGWIQGAISGVTDLLISMSPILILWNIQMKPSKKVAVCALMSLGLVATAANLTRTVLIKSLSEPDYTFNTIGIAIASVLEANLAIIAACIPAIRPIFKRIRLFIRTYLSNFRGHQTKSSSSKCRGPGVKGECVRRCRDGMTENEGEYREKGESIVEKEGEYREKRESMVE